MKLNDAYPSTNFNAETFRESGPQTLTVGRVELIDLGDTTKPKMSFKETDKGFIINKTNWLVLEDLLGSEDSDEWAGKQVELFAQRVQGPNGMTWGVRVRKPTTQTEDQPF